MRSGNRPGGQEGGRSFIEAARRAQIVECAIETIADLGYHQASLAQIARRAGISKGVISYHFAGKEELIRKVVDEVFQRGAEFMRPRIDAATGCPAKLRAYLESNLEFLHGHRRSTMALVEIFTQFRAEDGSSMVRDTVTDPVLEPLEQVFQRGQERGEFREFDVTVMAIAVRAAIDALPPRIAVEPGLDIARYQRELCTLFDLATRAG